VGGFLFLRFDVHYRGWPWKLAGIADGTRTQDDRKVVDELLLLRGMI
jgi:hypothetical protein